jgi:hypothetical protein
MGTIDALIVSIHPPFLAAAAVLFAAALAPLAAECHD